MEAASLQQEVCNNTCNRLTGPVMLKEKVIMCRRVRKQTNVVNNLYLIQSCEPLTNDMDLGVAFQKLRGKKMILLSVI